MIDNNKIKKYNFDCPVCGVKLEKKFDKEYCYFLTSFVVDCWNCKSSIFVSNLKAELKSESMSLVSEIIKKGKTK